MKSRRAIQVMRPRRAQASYFNRRSEEEDKEEESMKQPFFVHAQHNFTVGQLQEKQAGSPDPRQADSRPKGGDWEVEFPNTDSRNKKHQTNSRILGTGYQR